jgi:hypothetical protein
VPTFFGIQGRSSAGFSEKFESATTAKGTFSSNAFGMKVEDAQQCTYTRLVTLTSSADRQTKHNRRNGGYHVHSSF